MKTQYYTATSIDGYLADEENSLDWLFQFGEIEGMEELYTQFVEAVGAVAMGSTTYEWLIEHEDPSKEPEKWPYDVPTWVFSSRELPTIDAATSDSCRETSRRFTPRWSKQRAAITSGSSGAASSSGSSTIAG